MRQLLSTLFAATFLLSTRGTTEKRAIGLDTLLPNTQPIVAVGTRGTILSSDDGGFNWVSQIPEGGELLDLQGAFVLDDASALAVGGNCNGKYSSPSCGIFRRPAGTQAVEGQIWKKAALSVDGAIGENLRQLTAVTFCNTSLSFVVGQKGGILRSTDGGYNWGIVASGTSQDLLAVTCLPGQEVLVSGGQGIVLRSTDLGRSWRQPSSLAKSSFADTTQPLSALLFNSTRSGLVAGKGIWATDNAGLTWATYEGAGSPPPLIVAGHASRAWNPQYSIALLADVVLYLWAATPDSFNIAAAPSWTTVNLHANMVGKTVLLPGQGGTCVSCQGVLMGGSASVGGNSDCSTSQASCGATCCGPLQVKATDSSEFRTAMNKTTGVPIGCRSKTDCSIINGIAATTGEIPPISVVVQPSQVVTVPSSASKPNASLTFTVDVAGVTVFKPSLFVESIRPFLGMPITYTPLVSDFSSGTDQQSIVLSLADQGSFSVKQAVENIVNIASNSEGITSDICKSRTRRLQVPAGDWGNNVDIQINCRDYSMPFAVSTTLIVVCVAYYIVGIVLGLLFSLPKYRALQKSLHTAYALWFFFGILGTHRFYLRKTSTAILWLCTVGCFGFGWLADSFLTYSHYRTTDYDEDLEINDVRIRRVRNAARPEFISRREALRRISQRQQSVANTANAGGRVTSSAMMEDMDLAPGGFGADHVSPILYPKSSSRVLGTSNTEPPFVEEDKKDGLMGQMNIVV